METGRSINGNSSISTFRGDVVSSIRDATTFLFFLVSGYFGRKHLGKFDPPCSQIRLRLMNTSFVRGQ